MAKTAVFDWDTTAANNTDISSISLAENVTKPSDVNNFERTHMGQVAQWRNDLGGAATTTGTNTITVTLASTFTAYAAGQRFLVKLGGTNTGAATLNVNSLGAKSIKVLTTGSAADPVAGLLISGNYAEFQYDGTNMNLLSAPGAANPLSLSGSTAGYTPFQGISTEAGAAAGPISELYRNSASPAVNDILGQVLYTGQNSTPAKVTYGLEQSVVVSPTAGSEASTLDYYVKIGGQTTLVASLGSAGRSDAMVAGQLYRATLSNNSGAPTTSIDVAAGEAADSTNTKLIVLPAAITAKNLAVAWAVGSSAGMLDTGAVANNTYHIYLIQRLDTGVVDVIASLSASAPTLPTNYTLYRRVGSIVRTGGNILAFHQLGRQFIWDTPVADVTAVNPGTSAVTRTLTIPTGVVFEAILAIGTLNASSNFLVYFSALVSTDVAASNGNAQIQGTGAQNIAGYFRVWTNTSSQIRSRQNLSAGGDTTYINTLGWID